jgi:hypothetical protein
MEIINVKQKHFENKLVCLKGQNNYIVINEMQHCSISLERRRAFFINFLHQNSFLHQNNVFVTVLTICCHTHFYFALMFNIILIVVVV